MTQHPPSETTPATAPDATDGRAGERTDAPAGATDAGRPAGAAAPLTRRRLLGGVGLAGGAGLALGAAGGGVWGHAHARAEAPTPLRAVGERRVPFHGTHQAGIADPVVAQAHGHLVAFDLAPGAGRREAAALLRRWSRAAERLTRGEVPDGDHSGVALDAGPCALTVTFGFGRSFFDRTGLVARRPSGLAQPLPRFSADALDPRRSDGDLWVQIGADDALVAVAALDVLRRLAAQGPGGCTARLRWHMRGFNRTPGAVAQPRTSRNLMGQVDGTNNPRPEDEDFADHVFVPRDGSEPDWLAGGSYAVVRRIRMLLDDWEAEPLARQEAVIGRRKSDGAPLSGGDETTPVDLEKRDAEGRPVIPANAHVRVAAPQTNGGATMLRRSFSYHDGFREDGSPDAGLLFVCWQAHPDRGFVPVQRKLDRGDALSRYVRHEASALFAVPGGARPGEYVGQRLLEG